MLIFTLVQSFEPHDDGAISTDLDDFRDEWTRVSDSCTSPCPRFSNMRHVTCPCPNRFPYAKSWHCHSLCPKSKNLVPESATDTGSDLNSCPCPSISGRNVLVRASSFQDTYEFSTANSTYQVETWYQSISSKIIIDYTAFDKLSNYTLQVECRNIELLHNQDALVYFQRKS